MQVTHLLIGLRRSHIKGTVFDKIWHNSVYLCAIIKEGHTALSVNSYPGYILISGRDWDLRRESGYDALCLGHSILGCLQCGHFSLRGQGSLLWHHPFFLV